tara:strand:+ start:7351 stop:9492 length:2142 start_codon:yes stop_codon:yes gene_type:complete
MADVAYSDFVTGLAVDVIGGAEKIGIVDAGTNKHITPALISAYVIDQIHGAAAITTLTDTHQVSVFTSADDEKIITLANFKAWVIDELEAITTGTAISSGDTVLYNDGGVLKKIDIDTVTTYVNNSVLDLTSLAAGTPGSTDLFLFGSGATAKKITLANLETQLHTDFATYVNGLTENTTVTATDKFYCLQGGTPKFADPDALSAYFNLTTGDVTGPVSSTENKIPQWDSTSKKLKDGLGLVTTVRTVAGGAVDTNIPTEQAVAELIGDITSLDIDGATDIGAALTDSDLLIVDDGAGGTNRKCQLSRVKTYVGTAIKLDDLAAPDDNTDLDATTSKHGLMPKADKTKLDSIEASADVTDATNVDAAGATMNTDTDVSSNSWVVDEDDMSSDLNTKVPTQQSVKAYVATQTGLVSGLDIDGSTDIGADISDVDLIIVDDGAVGANRKATFSRIFTWITGKFQSLVTKSTPVDDDRLIMQDSENSNALTELTIGNLWDNRLLADAKTIKLDDFATPDDNTDLDASTSQHGLMKKLPGGTDKYYRADGTFATPGVAAGWDGDIDDVVFGSGSDIAEDLADGDQIIVGNSSDTDAPRQSQMSRVKKYSKKVQISSYSGNQTLTTTECFGYIVYVTGAATITLPTVADGMSLTIITIGAVAVSVDPNAADKIFLDGVALDDGDKITNASTAGDIAVLTYYSADGWHASTNGWTDGGA